ncbi:MAG: Protein of unknown function, rane YfhO [Planctomycetaceae bacterium]|nr:Protein of unknown function, rane YfhO [Planctomycetaceae bacterium]
MTVFGLKRSDGIAFASTVFLAIGLTYVFWPTLWQGGGLVGGDIYAYFFPQKQFLAESLRAGELPLWNNRTGHGYPIAGESQTGVFYPFHLLYAICDLNTAYVFIQLLHYVLASVASWMFLRRWGVGTISAWLGAVSFTYGWLPARMCNEWAALGAAWFPAILWCCESYLQTTRWRYLITLSGLLGLQMLAGHFHLAFITQVTLLGYFGLRLWLAADLIDARLLNHRVRTAMYLGVAVLCGFGLAAVQLLPTWELKQLSQRANLGPEHDPGFGFIPLWYLGQLIAPWIYYVPDVNLGVGSDGSRTNTVEAHLYCGILPLVLIVAGQFLARTRRAPRLWIWGLIGLLALVYTTGYLMPVARYLPGFGFFNGVGRFGIVFNFAVAVLAADSLQRLSQVKFGRWATWIGMTCVAITIIDTCWVSGLVQHTFAVEKPPIRYLEHSQVRKALTGVKQPVRLFCRGANLPNLLGVASTPVYLGLGPNPYFDTDWAMPQPLPFDTPPTPEQIVWLQQAGVTHVLSFSELGAAWPVSHMLTVADPFLNRAWGRGAAPLFLYELKGSRGRVAWQEPRPGDHAEIVDYRPNLVQIEANSTHGGTLILTDLAWAGWRVQIDGQRAESVVLPGIDRQFRVVEVPAGPHQIIWEFRPNSVWIGATISGVTLLFLAAIAHICFWHPRWVEWRAE